MWSSPWVAGRSRDGRGGHPEVFGGKSIGQVADHFETIIRAG
jgi:hypothetical protein